MNACAYAVCFLKGESISNSIRRGLLFYYWFYGRLAMPRCEIINTVPRFFYVDS